MDVRRLARTLGAALVLACACAAASAREGPLPAAVRQALQAAGLPEDALAAAALPLAHADAAWSYRGERPMQPGSAMKLVTSIVALDRLGPNLRGSTELRSAAPQQGGVLRGDLVLRGGADPELGIAEFWALLLELRHQGVSAIEGDLVLDRTLYRPARFDQGLPPFDDAPEFPYNVIPDALNLAGSLLALELRAEGDAVRATAVPPLEGLVLDAGAMTLAEGRCADWSDGWLPARVRSEGATTAVVLAGSFPRGCTVRARLQLIDRDELAGRIFATLWRGLGGQWSGRVRADAAPEGARLLARRQARPWGELLRPLNKVSDNVLSRLLFLNLGVSQMGAHPQASTAELAAREVQAWLVEHGIDPAGVVMDNGSGLSRSERIAPLQLAQMIRAAWHGRHAPELLMSLPVAGVDGTMRHRLKDSPAAGRARLKTGTLRDVVALAGVLHDDRGRPWAVAMMINHDDASRGRPVLDALVDAMARDGVHPRPAAAVGPQGDGP
jgi:D-alanyl-D-alanine carboxypeptidase/D-alanyl-D-alanine-endopeptidase (penicillin-binding protein 4)